VNSVRARLTAVLVLLAAVIATLAVIFGSRLVEQQLVDRQFDLALLGSVEPESMEVIYPIGPPELPFGYGSQLTAPSDLGLPARIPLDIEEFPPSLFSDLVTVEEYRGVTGLMVSDETFAGPVPRGLLYIEGPQFSDGLFSDAVFFDQDIETQVMAGFAVDVTALKASGALDNFFDDLATDVDGFHADVDQVDVILSASRTGILSRSGRVDAVERPPEGFAIALNFLSELSFVFGPLFDGGAPETSDLDATAKFSYREAADVRRPDVSPEQNSLRLIAGANITDVEGDVLAISRILWFAAVALVFFAGLATWILTGRALRPVGAIREQVLAINSGTLGERVPVANEHDEIGRLATTMNSMLERIETGLVQRRRFVSDAAHELRTPVAVLQSEAEVALRAPDRTSTEELASSVLGESRRLGAIVEDLLTLARVDEGSERPAGSVVDLDDLVLEQARRQRRLPVDRTGVSAGQVLGRSDDLERMVGHLIDNAARHGTSRVWVAVEAGDDVVRLMVDDDGDGISPADRERIFERFVRLDDARSRDAGGSGLGLSVVAATVREHGGTVSAGGSPHGGARITVTLPLAGGVTVERPLVPA